MNSKEAFKKLYASCDEVWLEKMYDINSPEQLEEIIYEDLERLEKLEDLEKELGIDLLTLFKALRQDYIYYKHHYGWDDRYKINKEYIQGLKYVDDNTPVFWTDDYGEEHMVYIKDYGKTWALTREVLEHDK